MCFASVDNYLFVDFHYINRPPQTHHLFGISTWSGVLKRAALKKKLVKDDKFSDKMDTRREETSRSESQASDNVTTIKVGNTMTQQTSVSCNSYFYLFLYSQKISAIFINFFDLNCF